MKNSKSILKAIGILFLIYVVLSWIIPTGYYSNGTFTTDELNPIGLFDLIRYPIINLTSSVFILTAIVILFTGGMYSVFNKTGAYQKLVNKIADKYNDKGEVFVTLSIIIFSILASFTGLIIPLFVLVPLFATVILLLGFDKMTALLSTVGAILVGNMGSTYGFGVNGYLSMFYKTDIHSSIWFRVLLLILLTVILILFTLKHIKKTTTKKINKNEIMLYEESKKNVKSTMLVILFGLMIIISLVGMFNWYAEFNIKFFTDIYEKIVDVKLNGYPIFKYMIGSIEPLGYWSNYEFALMIILTTALVGRTYHLKWNEIISSFIEGCKKMLPVAVLTVLANLIFLLMNSSSYSLYETICNYLFTLTDKLNAITVGASSIIGGVLYNEFAYMINAINAQVIAGTDNLTFISLVQQSFHGLTALMAPTSIILVIGLSYFDISYGSWLKKIWKYSLFALASILVVLIIMALL